MSGKAAAGKSKGRGVLLTKKALSWLGFKWPMPDGIYLRNVLKALSALGFFDGKTG